MSNSFGRPATTVVGRAAEDIAAGALQSAGFVILWRNLRLGALELDIVAQRNELVVIAEVRFRGPGAFAAPLASMTFAKRRTLVRAARELWKQKLRHRKEIGRVRIDVIAIRGESVEWIEGALTGDEV
jgi:putative endonuclease